MAELTQDVMFHDGDIEGYSSERIAALNFELMDLLGDLEPGSREYLARAKNSTSQWHAATFSHDPVGGLEGRGLA